MTNVSLDITMSLDGYVAGPDDGPGQGLGLRDGERLHDWLFTGDTTSILGDPFRAAGRSTEVLNELVGSAGAFLVGRRMFDAAEAWGGESPWTGVPTFVVTHRPPEGFAGTGFTFVTDGIEAAVDRAKEAAGEKDVSVGGGASIARQCLEAGLLDEIQIHLAPRLLGAGVRLFEELPEAIELEQTRVIEGRGITHVRYRVGSTG